MSWALGLLALALLIGIPGHRPLKARRSATAWSGRLPAGRRAPLLASVAVLAGCLAASAGRIGVLGALVLVPATWTLVRRVGRSRPSGPSSVELSGLPLLLDLVAALLAIGEPVEMALLAVVPDSGAWLGVELTQVASLLSLGASPDDAWRSIGNCEALRGVAATAIRSADSGIRLAGAFSELAVRLRMEGNSRAQARAQRVGVWAMAPLGLCFLPAFACLGIMPTIIGLAGHLLPELQR